MSRVGKMPVTIPAGVDVSIKEDQISVKGTGGALFLTQNKLVTITNDAGKLSFAPANDSREADAMSGTMRQLVNNMVVGVTKGYEKELHIEGVGYRAAYPQKGLKAFSRIDKDIDLLLHRLAVRGEFKGIGRLHAGLAFERGSVNRHFFAFRGKVLSQILITAGSRRSAAGGQGKQ